MCPKSKEEGRPPECPSSASRRIGATGASWLCDGPRFSGPRRSRLPILAQIQALCTRSGPDLCAAPYFELRAYFSTPVVDLMRVLYRAPPPSMYPKVGRTHPHVLTSPEKLGQARLLVSPCCGDNLGNPGEPPLSPN